MTHRAQPLESQKLFFFSFINVMFQALFIGITQTKVLTLNAIAMALTNVLLDYLLTSASSFSLLHDLVMPENEIFEAE